MPTDVDALELVRRVRRDLYEGGPTRARADGDFARVSIPLGDADALRDVLLGHGAGSVIEIGLAYGASALAIGEALLQHAGTTTHLIIDAYQDRFHDAGAEALDAAGLAGRVRLVRERSQLALPSLLVEGVTSDAAFVDGSHVFHNVFVDLFYLRELVRPGGLIVVDDCNYTSVATAARYFELNAGWDQQQFTRPTRLRAFRLPDRWAERAFEAFVPFAPES